MELDLWYDFTVPTTYFVDVFESLSLLNRKFLRQGQQVVIENLEMFSNGSTQAFVYRLPNTWVMANAWEKSMRLWLEQQNDRMEESGLESTIARYRDFKVFMDATHLATVLGGQPNALPLGVVRVDAAQPTAGTEWEYSQFVVPNDGVVGNTEEYWGYIIGDDITLQPAFDDGKGLIKAYAESRSRPFATEPNFVDVPFGGLFGEMRDVGDDSGDIITNAQDENHKPPYLIDADTGVEYYPGGSFQANSMTDTIECVMNTRSTAAAGGLNSTAYAPGFVCNLGLLAIHVTHPVAELAPTSTRFKIGILPGQAKGVMARPMQDVN